MSSQLERHTWLISFPSMARKNSFRRASSGEIPTVLRRSVTSSLVGLDLVRERRRYAATYFILVSVDSISYLKLIKLS